MSRSYLVPSPMNKVAMFIVEVVTGVGETAWGNDGWMTGDGVSVCVCVRYGRLGDGERRDESEGRRKREGRKEILCMME